MLNYSMLRTLKYYSVPYYALTSTLYSVIMKSGEMVSAIGVIAVGEIALCAVSFRHRLQAKYS